jgi:hypothetical protein
MLARKKSLRYINNKFTLNQKVLALLSLMQKITQLQKNGKIYLYFVSPSDGDFVIGPCRLQRPGTTAGNRQQ